MLSLLEKSNLKSKSNLGKGLRFSFVDHYHYAVNSILTGFAQSAGAVEYTGCTSADG